jgi:hypothetical protein
MAQFHTSDCPYKEALDSSLSVHLTRKNYLVGYSLPELVSVSAPKTHPHMCRDPLLTGCNSNQGPLAFVTDSRASLSSSAQALHM